MRRYHINNKDLVNIGEVAKIYNISKRTLRLYHEMDLLVPTLVDEQTGYRYYSPTQFPRLEMILQMKSAGLELKQIKKMLQTKNISLFEAVLGERIDELNRKIAEYQTNREALMRKLDSCKHIQNPPVLNSIFLEYIPKRSIFICDVDDYDLQKDYIGESPWENGLDRMKETLLENDAPLALFNQVGCLFSKETLMENRFVCNGAFIFVDNDNPYGLPKTSLSSGTYVCTYHKYTAMDNLGEMLGIRLLLQYIKDNNFVILGPCITEVIAEASIFDYSDNNILVKQQIQVALSDE